MANKYDTAALSANAAELEALAATARSSMLRHTTEKATRLGADGERLARQAKAAEAQRGDAEALAKNHLHEATGYDAKASSLDQRAAAAEARRGAADLHEATELREDAAKQRQGAEVARCAAQIANDDAQRLAKEATDLRSREQAIDAELADMGARLQTSEMAVDNLEWHAERARSMADTVGRAEDLQRQAVEATARGDTAAAATLGQRAATLRDDADAMAFVRGQPPFVLDQRALADLGVDLEPGTLEVPMPELIDPTSPFGPLASATPGDVGGEALAGDASAADADADGAAFGDTEFASTFETPSFETPSFETPSFEAPSFEAPSFEPDSFDSDPMVVASDFSDGATPYDESVEQSTFGVDGASEMFG